MAQTPNTKLNKHPTGSAQSNNAVIDNNWDILDAALGNTIGQGILADLPATGQFNGATYWVTDGGNDFAKVWDAVGVTWITKTYPTMPTLPYITGRGILADRPADGETVGGLYFVTDQTGIAFYVWDGAAWQTELAPALSGLDANLPATAENGAVYIPTDNVEVILYIRSGGVWVSKFVTMSGLEEDLPVSAEDGAVYIPTDNAEVVLYIRSGGLWLAKSGGGGGGGVTPVTGIVPGIGDEVTPTITDERASDILSNYINDNLRSIDLDFTVESAVNSSGFTTPTLQAKTGWIYYLLSSGNNHDLWKINPDTMEELLVVNDPFGASVTGTLFAGTTTGKYVVFALHGAQGKHILRVNAQDDSFILKSSILTEVPKRMGPLDELGSMILTYAGDELAIYDQNFNAETKIAIPTPVSSWCYLPNGKIMLAPTTSGNPFYLYSPMAQTFEVVASPGTGTFFNNGVLIPGNKIVWIPALADVIRIYDFSTNTWEESVDSKLSITGADSSPCLLPSGEIIIPQGFADFQIFDTITYGITDIPATAFFGLPANGPYAKQYQMTANGKLVMSNGISNKAFPIQVVDIGCAPIGRGIATDTILLGTT